MQLTKLALLMITATTTACTGGGGGGDGVDGGGGGSGSDMPAWSDGPVGHVYTSSGPLFDLDAHDGSILRELDNEPVGQLRATADTAYMTKFDDEGTGRVWKLDPGATEVTRIADQSVTILAVVGGELIGLLNNSIITRTTIASGEIAKIPMTLGSIACFDGSVFAHTVYLACTQYAAAGNTDVLVTYDLDAMTFGPVVAVTPLSGTSIYGSLVTGTANGALYTHLETVGGALSGTRTAYRIVGTTVSGPVTLAGPMASNLDQQDAVGDTLFVSQPLGDQVVTFDAAAMAAGAPIAMAAPRALCAGGGQVWIATHQHDGQLAKLDPATSAVEYKTFPKIVSTEIDSLAFGGDQ